MAKIGEKEMREKQVRGFYLGKKRKKFITQRREEERKEKERAFVRVEATGLGTE